MQFSIMASRALDTVLRGLAWFGLVFGFLGLFFDSLGNQAPAVFLIVGYSALAGYYQSHGRGHMIYLVFLSAVITTAASLESASGNKDWWMQVCIWLMFAVAHIPLLLIFILSDRFDETRGTSLQVKINEHPDRE